MNAVRRLVLLALIAVLGVMASVPTASLIENELFGVTPYPEEADGIDRGAFRIPLETGETFEDAIRIYSQTEPIELTVYAADAEAGSGEADVEALNFGFRDDDPKGLASWIDLSRESVQLAPRDEVIVSFRVTVKSADPRPAHGAIVVETKASGQKRETLTVLSAPGGTETTSDRIRPLLLRSPWIVVAMIGLLVAIALVWIGARRARRPKDVLVPAGEIDQPELEDDIPDASRPVIKRLGASEGETRPKPRNQPHRAAVIERPRRTTRGSVPLIEDAFLVEVDDEDDFGDDNDDADPVVTSDDTDDDIGMFDADDDEDGVDDLPPARHRPAGAKRSSGSASKGGTASKQRTTPKKKPARPAAKKPSPSRRKTPSKASSKKKTAAKGKAKPKTKAKATSRSRTTKRSDASAYIPLDDL